MNFTMPIYSLSLLLGIFTAQMAVPLHGFGFSMQQEISANQIQTSSAYDAKVKLLNKPENPVVELPSTGTDITASKMDLGQNNQIEQVILNQLEDLRDLDISKAYYANMSSDFQKTFSLDMFKAYVRKNPVFFRNKQFDLESNSFRDVLAVVTGKLTGIDGQTARVQYDLIQENGVWKIRSIDMKLLAMPPATPRVKMTRPQR